MVVGAWVVVALSGLGRAREVDPWVQVWTDAAWHLGPAPESAAFALGAALDGSRSEHAGRVIAARVVERRPGWVRVATQGGIRPSFDALCAPPLTTTPLEIVGWVAEADLSPVLVGQLAGADPSGYPKFDLLPGLPLVADGATWVARSGPLTVRVRVDPKDVGTSWVPVETPPARVGAGHTLAPLVLGVPARYKIEVTEPAAALADDEGTWAVRSGCLAVLGKGGAITAGVPPRVARPDAPASWRLAPSTPVSLPSGETIGTVVGSTRLIGEELPGDAERRCLSWAGHPVTVCAPTASVSALPAGWVSYHHSELEVVKREQPKHPRSPEGTHRCIAEVAVGADGVPADVAVFGCPNAFHEPTREALSRWRWAPPPRGRGVVEVGVSFKVERGG